MSLPDPPILVITDRAQCAEPLEDRAVTLFGAGCRWLSLREKDLPPDERVQLLERLMTAGAKFGATVGVHGDLAAATACRAALHLSAGADSAEARRTLGPGVLIGQSCHDRRELAAAAAGGVDYATLGPVFASRGKPGYAPTFDIEGFAAMVAAARVPVVALGGVTERTLPSLARTGIRGIAVMSGAMSDAQPAAWFERMLRLWTGLSPNRAAGRLHKP